MWIDSYLKFPDEATAFEALYKPVVQTMVVLDEEGTPTYTEEVVEGEFVPRYDMSIDTIGVIYKPTGETLQGEDGPYPEMKPVSGWHVNTRGEMPEALKAYAVEVNSPVRVWA
jgi:hypothetical protein